MERGETVEAAAARELTLSFAIGAIDYWEIENLDRPVGLFHIVMG